jgi:hypothetical protein
MTSRRQQILLIIHLIIINENYIKLMSIFRLVAIERERDEEEMRNYFLSILENFFEMS